MLWKYKKCYQETSELEPCGSITLTSVEEVVTPVNCYKLVSAEYNSIELPAQNGSIEATICGEVTTINEGLPNTQTVTINQCIVIESIKINDVLQTITDVQVDDAITNNGGLLNISIVNALLDPIASVTLIFENCTTQSKFGSRSVDFVDGSNNDPLNLPQDPCQLTLIEGIFVFQVNNPVSTTPIVGDVICYTNDINDFVNGAGHWYKITISIYTDVTFVKIGTNGVVTQVSNVICA